MRNSRLLNVYDVKSEGDNDVAENVENVKWKKRRAGIESALLTVRQILRNADNQGFRKFQRVLQNFSL